MTDEQDHSDDPSHDFSKQDEKVFHDSIYKNKCYERNTLNTVETMNIISHSAPERSTIDTRFQGYSLMNNNY